MLVFPMYSGCLHACLVLNLYLTQKKTLYTIWVLACGSVFWVRCTSGTQSKCARASCRLQFSLCSIRKLFSKYFNFLSRTFIRYSDAAESSRSLKFMSSISLTWSRRNTCLPIILRINVDCVLLDSFAHNVETRRSIACSDARQSLSIIVQRQ